MQYKKITLIILTLIITFTFFGCFGDNTSITPTNDNEILEGENISNKIETTTYQINNYNFNIPNYWEIDSTFDSENTLRFIQKNNGDLLIIENDKIPDILKINTGSEYYISTKEDLVAHCCLDSLNVTSSEWKTLNGLEYYEEIGTLDNDTNNELHFIIIPINGIESYISIILKYNPENSYLEDINILLASLNK